jgi:hypothetical protein
MLIGDAAPSVPCLLLPQFLLLFFVLTMAQIEILARPEPTSSRSCDVLHEERRKNQTLLKISNIIRLLFLAAIKST